jgi:hypothetical protein
VQIDDARTCLRDHGVEARDLRQQHVINVVENLHPAIREKKSLRQRGGRPV